MQIKEIADSRYNHGTRTEIIATVTVQHEIAFSPGDVVTLLNSLASDSMAKVINHIGSIFNKDQFAEACAVDDLDEDGKQFIEDMYYFTHHN